MQAGPLAMPFSTKMTLVRLPGGALWVHSPIAPDPALFAEIEALGTVGWLVAPNTLHYWWIPDWKARYPAAAVCAPPAVAAKAKRPNLISRAVQMGLPALALTDESNLFALVKFYRAAEANGVKPIAGADLWIAGPNDASPSRPERRSLPSPPTRMLSAELPERRS